MLPHPDSNADPAILLEGVYVANVTPFRDDERASIDLEAYLGHVRWLADAGVTGVVPFGTNGEGPSVATREKAEVLEAVVAAAGPLHVVATVAEGTLPDTLDLLAHLDGLPVRALLVLPPWYFRPVADEGLRRFYDRVLAATRHPVVVYHIPKYAVAVPAGLIAGLPVWGVKDSGGEAGYAEAVTAANRGVLLGTEDDLPDRLPTVQGSVSALANIVPEQVIELYGHVRAGRSTEAAALSAHLRRVRAMTKQHDAPAVLKRVAEQRHGHPMGTVRPPLVPLPASFDAATAAASAVSGPAVEERGA
ncbi:dihydrodipicolinate synthase family protein [Kineococcus arenarius]|uniref:dihydrodipicolinate synthase family protein n=1 Tax=unclassified Kineococcus TaxID=2621656 RepID=UPI003D7E1A6C